MSCAQRLRQRAVQFLRSDGRPLGTDGLSHSHGARRGHVQCRQVAEQHRGADRITAAGVGGAPTPPPCVLPAAYSPGMDVTVGARTTRAWVSVRSPPWCRDRRDRTRPRERAAGIDGNHRGLTTAECPVVGLAAAAEVLVDAGCRPACCTARSVASSSEARRHRWSRRVRPGCRRCATSPASRYWAGVDHRHVGGLDRGHLAVPVVVDHPERQCGGAVLHLPDDVAADAVMRGRFVDEPAGPCWLTKMPPVNHSANAERPSGWVIPGDHQAWSIRSTSAPAAVAARCACTGAAGPPMVSVSAAGYAILAAHRRVLFESATGQHDAATCPDPHRRAIVVLDDRARRRTVLGDEVYQRRVAPAGDVRQLVECGRGTGRPGRAPPTSSSGASVPRRSVSSGPANQTGVTARRQSGDRQRDDVPVPVVAGFRRRAVVVRPRQHCELERRILLQISR